ncbi:MAG TPA: DUF4012 domain-containing protein [Actinomycetes bacterium]|jgi:hypothetical protein|nr:DUF4012 domain-containing protein [Actinomycetes bacterium]
MAAGLGTVTPDGTTAPGRPRRRWGRWVALAMLLAVAGAVAAGAWLALGLTRAARDVKTSATAARADLKRASRALRAGDDAGARRAVQAARTELRRADAAAARTPVRIAGRLPVAASPVADLGHLLAAGHVLVGTADRALGVQARVTGDKATLFRNGRVDLATAARAVTDTTAILGDLDRARAELRQVRGGRFAPGAAQARDATLREVDDLDRQVRPLVTVLRALPPAVGADGPRTYLVAVMNSAELKAMGGAPLAVALVRFELGKVSILRRGEATEQRLNLGVSWPYLPGDPWHPPGSVSRFTSSGLSPHFPTSGEEMLRAYQAITGTRGDGVIAMDPTAFAKLLRVTGPVSAPGYGSVSGKKLVRLLLADSYQRIPDKEARHRVNEALMDAMLGRILTGGKLLGQVEALGEAAKGRHVQLYFRDAGLQRTTLAHGLGGDLSPAPQDYLAVYTQNGNASKVDFYQRRSIEQVVRLAPDGSARVTRTVRLVNATPAGAPAGERSGYFTSWGRPGVIAYLPDRATAVSARVDGKQAGWAPFRELGRQVVRLLVSMPPGSTRTVTVEYRLPRAAVRDGAGLRYALAADTQPIVNPASLRVVVVPPPGFGAPPQPGWKAEKGTLVATRPFTSDQALTLRLQH